MKTRMLMMIVLFVVYSMSLFSGWSIAAAQDVPAATETLSATVEPTAEVTPAPVELPADNGSSTSLILNFLKEVALIIAVVVLAFKTASLIPAKTVNDVLGHGFDLAKELANTTDTPVDNQFLEIAKPVVLKWVQDELAKQGTVNNITINPATLTESGTINVSDFLQAGIKG